jgi:glycosyltransferase involved in cell wall biosynthesis
MSGRVLHLLSQRPSLTGSGVTLDALVRQAALAGWEQRVIVGTPADDPAPKVGGLPPEQVVPVVFGQGDLDFLLPGMSDVMPYPSSRWSELEAGQLGRYRAAWRRRLGEVVARFAPDVIHSHHLWVMSSLIKDVCPDVPVVVHCHATAFRQMALCPHFAEEIKAGVRRNDRFAVLHRLQACQLVESLGVAADRVTVVGAGFRGDLFHAPPTAARPRGHLLYAGKLASAKGLPWLLEAVERSARSRELVLHVAGGGAGAEAEALREDMARLSPRVCFHGRLDQRTLAELMRQCSIFVLPSLYEGLPLVLVEALACGCRLVCTALPAVEQEIAPYIGEALDLVPLPRLGGVDRPRAEELPAFVRGLEEAILRALDLPLLGDPAKTMAETLDHFSWAAVFLTIESVWKNLL